MNGKNKYDFSGYATKVGLKCSDGRTILQDAFQDSDGKTVPLVWQHLHNDPGNILGHALLENRKDGVYAYCSLNSSSAASDAKEAIIHGDITALSIYANSLIEKGKNVIHGAIREVSLVIAGANPEAYIDNLAFEHGDGSIVQDESEAIISANIDLEIFHSEDSKKEDNGDDETVGDVFNTLNDKQKTVVYAMIAEALKTSNEESEEESEESDEDELAHFGVMGMKWGVRNSSGSMNDKNSQRTTKKEIRDHRSKIMTEYAKRSDKELAQHDKEFISKYGKQPIIRTLKNKEGRAEEQKRANIYENELSKRMEKVLNDIAVNQLGGTGYKINAVKITNGLVPDFIITNENEYVEHSNIIHEGISWKMDVEWDDNGFVKSMRIPEDFLDIKDEELEDNSEVKHTSIEGDINMKKNIFDNDSTKENNNVLTRDELQQIFKDARQSQSTIKNSFLAHGFDSISEAYEAYEEKQSGSLKHSITDIEYLFPDYKTVGGAPVVLAPREEWVSKVFNQARHIPFSRIKTIVADITKDEARALGYIKGNEKAEEVFSLLKRTTDPQTVYKKQKLDRDDIIDITDFDVIVWLRNEMRGRLEAELARAMLVSDGRSAASDDKINETKVRPIATDDPLYTIPVVVSPEDDADTEPTTSEIIDAVIRSRKDYKGTGTPSLFIRTDLLGDMLLLKDSLGRRIYNTMEELSSALRVKEIIEVPVMDNIVNPDPLAVYSELAAILVNMADYALGADKGGAVNMFDDFDIDFNQYKYLIETRVSGALTMPHSAIAFWTEAVEPEVAPSA